MVAQMSDPANGGGHRSVPGWVNSLIGPVVACLLGGAVVGIQAKAQLDNYGEQIREMSATVREQLDGLDKATRERFEAANTANGDRLTA